MFGLDNRTLLSKDIIEILDQVDYGLSVEDIQNKLGYSNPVTILSVCKEITAVIKKNYIHNHYQLEIDNSKRGLFELKRYSTNLQSLYKEIFSKDIAYDILMVLIQKRSISSEKICQTYNISRSTLQRKIKAINKEIADFQVYITCSERIQFKSDELLIRSFSYFFFWSMHRELDNTFWFPEGEQHLFNAKRILDYLGCAFDPIKSRSLALWIQFFSIGIAKKKTLNFSAEKLQFLESCQIPECPDFLTAWSNLEWRTLVGVIYVSNVYEYELVFQIEAVEPFLSARDLCYEDFERAAEKQFSSISSYEKTKIQREIARYQLLNLFINPQAKKSLRTITNHVLSFDFLKQNYPTYWEKYAYFWNDLKNSLRMDEQHSYMRYLCLTICLAIFPLKDYLPEIKIHLTSDVDSAYKNYLKQAIALHFKNFYSLHFIDNFKQAEIIVSTLPFPNQYLTPSQKSLVIRAQLSEKDFGALEQLLKKHIKSGKS